MRSLLEEVMAITNEIANDNRAKNYHTHVLDISRNSLGLNEEQYALSIQTLLQKFSVSNSLEDILVSKPKRPIIVQDTKWGVFLVGPDYSAIKSSLDGALSGSINYQGNLESKIASVKARVAKFPMSTKLIQSSLNSLISTKSDLLIKTVESRGQEGEFSNLLGYSAVYVTLDSSNNTKLVESSLKGLVTSQNFIDSVLNDKKTSEKSILEALEQHLVDTIRGNGKRYSKPKVKEATKKVKSNNKATLHKAPKIRSTTGRFTSLVNLETILRLQLIPQVISNMGRGYNKDVLNYRTGRFANSSKIERLQMQRDGAIAIYYSYMKYPYQTFERGYKQGYPLSRDPRNLISKSIREIAAEVVTARLRTIRV